MTTSGTAEDRPSASTGRTSTQLGVCVCGRAKNRLRFVRIKPNEVLCYDLIIVQLNISVSATVCDSGWEARMLLCKWSQMIQAACSLCVLHCVSSGQDEH